MTNATADATAITTTWPSGFPAHKAGVGAFAVREVAADADAVFAWLRRVDLHESYYGALRMVRRRGGAWPVLEQGTAFSMLLGGLFVPYIKVTKLDTTERSLAWGSNTPLFSACHAFTVKPIGEGRSLIRSEERFVGPIARVVKPVAAGQLQKVQTEWTEAVVRAATAFPAGPPSA
ncbi:MAG: SRPBCC family protein, partial [Solirubrobacteraceae bacterium]|nr:SRPBCC family protein [Solirubrobacteraceae bacterium]